MLTRDAPIMPTVARDTLRGDELPRRLVAQLGDGRADDVYLVEARALSPEDALKLAKLRADLQLGIDQLDAGKGRPFDVEALLANFHAKHDNNLEARAGVQRGLADSEAGRVYSEEDAMRFIFSETEEEPITHIGAL